MRMLLFALGVATLCVIALQKRIWQLPARPVVVSSAASSNARVPAPTRRLAAFGYSKLLADWYWLQAIQYYGTPANEKVFNRGLSELLEESTDLDPGFDYVYQFGGETLPYHDPDKKLWHNTQAAIDLLRKGVQAGSTRWQVPWLLGYTLFTYRGAYVEAGHEIERAAKLPGAPSYLPSLAVRLLAQGSEIDTAIYLTQSALAQAQDDRTKEDTQDRLNSLLLQKDLDILNRALEDRRKSGPVTELADLVGTNGLEVIPDDPFGGQFRLDRERNKVTSAHSDKLMHLFIHPGSPTVEQFDD
jgi:hypothetical protein